METLIFNNKIEAEEFVKDNKKKIYIALDKKFRYMHNNIAEEGKKGEFNEFKESIRKLDLHRKITEVRLVERTYWIGHTNLGIHHGLTFWAIPEYHILRCLEPYQFLRLK